MIWILILLLTGLAGAWVFGRHHAGIKKGMIVWALLSLILGVFHLVHRPEPAETTQIQNVIRSAAYVLAAEAISDLEASTSEPVALLLWQGLDGLSGQAMQRLEQGARKALEDAGHRIVVVGKNFSDLPMEARLDGFSWTWADLRSWLEPHGNVSAVIALTGVPLDPERRTETDPPLYIFDNHDGELNAAHIVRMGYAVAAMVPLATDPREMPNAALSLEEGYRSRYEFVH